MTIVIFELQSVTFQSKVSIYERFLYTVTVSSYNFRETSLLLFTFIDFFRFVQFPPFIGSQVP